MGTAKVSYSQIISKYFLTFFQNFRGFGFTALIFVLRILYFLGDGLACNCLDRGETSKVAPWPIGRDGIDVGRFFHHGIIDRDLLAAGEEILHGSLFSGSVEGDAVHHPGDGGSEGPELLFDGAGVPYENAGVPVITSFCQILFGQFKRGPLRSYPFQPFLHRKPV